MIGPHGVAVPTHLFKVILAEGGPSGRRLSAFVMPNAPVAGHPDLDAFVWPLEEVERHAGVRIFGELPERSSVPPLCAGEAGPRCGLGTKVDGIIRSNKALGHVTLAADCKGLEDAWQRLVGDKKPSWLQQRKYDDRAQTLACPRVYRA